MPMFLNSNDVQLGRGEPIKDTARVLGRMVHGIIIRTFAQQDVEEIAEYSGLPTINALTDEEHPCQILADLLTIRERLGGWDGRKVSFFGDGDCNMGRSWAWAAKRLGFELVIAFDLQAVADKGGNHHRFADQARDAFRIVVRAQNGLSHIAQAHNAAANGPSLQLEGRDCVIHRTEGIGRLACIRHFCTPCPPNTPEA